MDDPLFDPWGLDDAAAPEPAVDAASASVRRESRWRGARGPQEGGPQAPPMPRPPAPGPSVEVERAAGPPTIDALAPDAQGIDMLAPDPAPPSEPRAIDALAPDPAPPPEAEAIDALAPDALALPDAVARAIEALAAQPPAPPDEAPTIDTLAPELTLVDPTLEDVPAPGSPAEEPTGPGPDVDPEAVFFGAPIEAGEAPPVDDGWWVSLDALAPDASSPRPDPAEPAHAEAAGELADELQTPGDAPAAGGPEATIEAPSPLRLDTPDDHETFVDTPLETLSEILPPGADPFEAVPEEDGPFVDTPLDALSRYVHPEEEAPEAAAPEDLPEPAAPSPEPEPRRPAAEPHVSEPPHAPVDPTARPEAERVWFIEDDLPAPPKPDQDPADALAKLRTEAKEPEPVEARPEAAPSPFELPDADVPPAEIPPAGPPTPRDDAVSSLRALLLPRIERLSQRLVAARHQTTLDDRLRQDPPALRFRLEPWLAPFDPRGDPIDAVLEVVLEGRRQEMVTGRLWLDPLARTPAEQRATPTREVDAAWIERLLLDFVEKALAQA